jgi:hypothetical protein
MDNNPEAGLLYVQADSLFRKQYQLFPKAVVGHFVESLLQRKQIDPELLRFASIDIQQCARGLANIRNMPARHVNNALEPVGCFAVQGL